jgi:hypothetical protein
MSLQNAALLLGADQTGCLHPAAFYRQNPMPSGGLCMVDVWVA